MSQLDPSFMNNVPVRDTILTLIIKCDAQERLAGHVRADIPGLPLWADCVAKLILSRRIEIFRAVGAASEY
jgi:hypothetical protein